MHLYILHHLHHRFRNHSFLITFIMIFSSGDEQKHSLLIAVQVFMAFLIFNFKSDARKHQVADPDYFKGELYSNCPYTVNSISWFVQIYLKRYFISAVAIRYSFDVVHFVELYQYLNWRRAYDCEMNFSHYSYIRQQQVNLGSPLDQSACSSSQLVGSSAISDMAYTTCCQLIHGCCSAGCIAFDSIILRGCGHCDSYSSPIRYSFKSHCRSSACYQRMWSWPNPALPN